MQRCRYWSNEFYWSNECDAVKYFLLHNSVLYVVNRLMLVCWYFTSGIRSLHNLSSFIGACLKLLWSPLSWRFIFGILLQTDTDYWLLSDAGVGISDMWRSDRILFSKQAVGSFLCLENQTQLKEYSCQLLRLLTLPLFSIWQAVEWILLLKIACKLKLLIMAAYSLTFHYCSFQCNVGWSSETERRIRNREHRVTTTSHSTI